MLSRMCNFYPRPPRGGRLIYQATTEDDRKFLSTPSARRATLSNRLWLGRLFISIHALREEGDPFSAVRFWLQKVFLSTPSARRATKFCLCIVQIGGISIHALREEGDRRVVPLFGLTLYFYPRPPRGGRQLS